MKSKIFKILAFLSLCELISCKGYFTIVGSKLMRHQAKYQVSVGCQDFAIPPVLELAIRNSSNTGVAYELAQNVTLINGKTQNIEFDLKDQPVQDYNLEAKSLTGERFEKIVRLNLNTKKHSVFVQTDKSMYKPSDKVQFRVLVLDASMKPLENQSVEIFISDGGDNRVKQFSDVKFAKGVYQNELQLSDSPVLGNWKLHVKLNGSDEKKKEFEVAEYTLPKFQVTLDASPDANFKDGKVRATVRAKYTFGKIAKGNATVTAEVMPLRYWGHKKIKKVSKSVEVNGKKPIEFDIAEELGLTGRKHERTVKLYATFLEELTGKEQNATATVKIHITPHKIQVITSSEKVKPGLPFVATAIVQSHDKGAPVTDKVNPVTFTIKYYSDKLKTCEHYDKRGSYECREEISFSHETPMPLLHGTVAIDINVPSNTTKIDVEAKYLETVESKRNVNKVTSGNNQYIQAELLTKKPKLTDAVELKVLATHSLTRLTMQVVNKGNIFTTKTFEIKDTKTFTFDFKPTLAMIPKSNVIVYYITHDGEIISDSLEVKFENELKNHIDVEISNAEVKPGADLKISVHTNPGSFVGLLGVDQSVLIMKSGNDIEHAAVFGEIDAYNQVNQWNYQWARSMYHESAEEFKKLDTVMITNADYQNPKLVAQYEFSGYMNSQDGEKVFDRRPGSSDDRFYAAPMASHAMSSHSAIRVQDESDHRNIESSRITPSAQQKPVEIRKTFPETWLFESFDFDSKTSNVSISKKVPDTITSWIITGFSVDPVTGLGLTKQPTKLNVFQPFFVSTNLPYSIKRGEVVSIPIIVFNYLDEDQEAEVTFHNNDSEFEFVEVKEDENQVRRRKRALDLQRKKTVLVKSQSGITVSFMIRPLKVGHITVKVIATTNVAGDGVERQLIVEPEGVTQYKNQAVFIDLRNSPEFKSTVNISVPPHAVPDSTKIEASAIGDILGLPIENLDKLIKLPYGCGEQNMLNFVPNIVVLDYLTATGKLTPEIEEKTKKFTETGYQKQLTYKHDDGSYSVFGKSDRSGSTWLTAFVAKSFTQASKYIMLDENIIGQALNFLAGVQAPNGSFPEVGHVSYKAMQGGSSNGVALTAYTLITFLENEKLAKRFQNVIDKASQYIVESFKDLEDNYSLTIATYAMQMAKHPLKDALLAKLESKSVNINDGKVHWEKEVPKLEVKSPWISQPNSVNVEMSAYALQAYIQSGRETDGVPIMKWLVGQRNANGGFLSTQDTVVGLQALAKLAAKISAPNSHVDITVAHDHRTPTSLSVNDENSMILQKYELPAAARSFEVSATGNGFSILQLSYKYNINNTGEWPRFVLNPEVIGDSNKDFLHLTVCTSFVPDESADKSNMAVMEVTFPSGYTFDTDTTPELERTKKVKKIETKDGETVVVLYFDDISAEKICPEFKAFKTHSVANLKPAPVIIYDYYDNSRRARSFYNPPEISLCDICNGAEECIADCEQEEINVI